MVPTETMRSLRLGALLLLASLGWAARPAGQAASPTLFTAAQADAGRATYKVSCASCHMPDLGGRDEAPQLAGDDFLSAWKTRKVSELYDFIHATMPPEGPALTEEQAVGLVALILQENGATAGSTALAATSAETIGSVAPGRALPIAEAGNRRNVVNR